MDVAFLRGDKGNKVPIKLLGRVVTICMLLVGSVMLICFQFVHLKSFSHFCVCFCHLLSKILDCRFPKYMPPGLFEMLSVRAHREKHKLKFLSHWGSGFHARHKGETLQVREISYRPSTCD